MNPKDLARMLPNLLGAAATLITVVLLIVGLTVEPGEGSSNSSSNRGASSTSTTQQSSTAATPAPQTTHLSPVQSTPSPENRETHTPKATTTSTQRRSAGLPPRSLPPRQRPATANSTTKPTNTPQFTKPAPVPTPKEEDPALNDPEVPATATLGYDSDSNRTATWIHDGFRYTKTYTDDGTTLNKTNEGLRTKTVTTSKDGITYYTEYDEQDNPLTTRSSGVYTPPRDPFENFTPPPLPPREPSSRTDPAVEKQYTPRELETEIRRQFDEWNQYREDRGLNKGIWDENLANAAQKWANKLAEVDNGTGRVYRTTPHESDYARLVHDPSYNFIDLNAGENVWKTDAYNVNSSLKVFAKSPAHNENLLVPERRGVPVAMGIGIAKGQGLDHNGRIPYYVVYKMKY